jgi:hypothetical protein
MPISWSLDRLKASMSILIGQDEQLKDDHSNYAHLSYDNGEWRNVFTSSSGSRQMGLPLYDKKTLMHCSSLNGVQ